MCFTIRLIRFEDDAAARARSNFETERDHARHIRTWYYFDTLQLLELRSVASDPVNVLGGLRAQ